MFLQSVEFSRDHLEFSHVSLVPESRLVIILITQIMPVSVFIYAHRSLFCKLQAQYFWEPWLMQANACQLLGSAFYSLSRSNSGAPTLYPSWRLYPTTKASRVKVPSFFQASAIWFSTLSFCTVLSCSPRDTPTHEFPGSSSTTTPRILLQPWILSAAGRLYTEFLTWHRAPHTESFGQRCLNSISSPDSPLGS